MKMKKQFLIAEKMSLLVALLAIVASIGGLLLENLYRDSEAIRAVWFVNDLITLFVAVPILMGSIYFASKGSIRASLVWVGSLWYMLYNYVFYMYGAAFNAFLLIYILLFVLSVYSLILTLVQINVVKLKSQLLDRAPTKAVSTFLFAFAGALGFPWVMLALRFIQLGETPPFEMTIVFATDLSFLVSVLIFSGILLRKKNPWGVVLSAMVMLKGVLYPLVLIIGGALAFVRVGTWDVFIPLYAVLWLLCIYFYQLLLSRIGVEKI
ncbi:hypothetical protein F9B85_08780 [Heliorestis acidaminivorans]|uniref:Uncharacterized protein n=1 Tax=Heliorestis acidaminivorans TaxID=553427 RepID=A0A6I0F0Y3_9FIRM|nr:hypothetical protein [Heliorestis acidaminivorans]KAB2952734.1 hypothetical protein F9B85_08780 [Heliorestis acidaminivorans]